MDSVIARMKEIERELATEFLPEEKKEPLRLELADLEEQDRFAKERIKLYCQSHRNLEHEEKTCVVSLDFTAAQTSMQSKFCDFVVVVATHSPISIPPTMLDQKIIPSTPPSLKGHEQLVIDNSQKKKRRTKKEMMDVERPPVMPNLRDDIITYHKKKKMPVVTNVSHFKPSLNYLHFVIKRDAKIENEDGMVEEVKVSQTFDYVQWVLEFLEEHKFFDGFERVRFWSDGCGKHFKTYSSHFFMASYQQRLAIPLTWDFLAPNRGIYLFSVLYVYD